MEHGRMIERWFKEELGGTLVLPDGWYGRPYDNVHTLTKLDETADSLTLALDHKLSLHFEGLERVEARAMERLFLDRFAGSDSILRRLAPTKNIPQGTIAQAK